MSQEEPQKNQDADDNQDDKVASAVKKTGVFVGKSLTVNHITRLFNRGSRRAYSVGEGMLDDLERVKTKSDFCCPYCSQTFLSQEQDDPTVWSCDSCHATYTAGKDKKDLYKFMSEHGRSIYLKGKGKPNTAYTRHGFDETTEVNTLAQINALYIGSKIVFVLALFVFVQIFRTESALNACVFLAMWFATMFYSMYYAYRAYCLATRQMYVYGRWHFLYWLKSVGLLYMFHVGKRAGYQNVVQEFEIKEALGDFDHLFKKPVSNHQEGTDDEDEIPKSH